MISRCFNVLCVNCFNIFIKKKTIKRTAVFEPESHESKFYIFRNAINNTSAYIYSAIILSKLTYAFLQCLLRKKNGGGAGGRNTILVNLNFIWLLNNVLLKKAK